MPFFPNNAEQCRTIIVWLQSVDIKCFAEVRTMRTIKRVKHLFWGYFDNIVNKNRKTHLQSVRELLFALFAKL